MVLRASAEYGHAEGVDDEFGAHVVGDGPSDCFPGEYIDDCRAVDFPFSGGVFGDVGAPDLIRSVDGEVAVDQVGVGVGVLVPDGAAVVASPVEALDPGLAHQPSDAFVVHRDTESEGELGVHTWPSVGAPGLCVDFLDVFEEQFVLLRP